MSTCCPIIMPLIFPATNSTDLDYLLPNLTLNLQHFFSCSFLVATILRFSIIDENFHWSFHTIFATHLNGASVGTVPKVSMAAMLVGVWGDWNGMKSVSWLRSSGSKRAETHSVPSARQKRRLKCSVTSFICSLIIKGKRDFLLLMPWRQRRLYCVGYN
jgi:hypothetical protein